MVFLRAEASGRAVKGYRIMWSPWDRWVVGFMDRWVGGSSVAVLLRKLVWSVALSLACNVVLYFLCGNPKSDGVIEQGNNAA